MPNSQPISAASGLCESCGPPDRRASRAGSVALHLAAPGANGRFRIQLIRTASAGAKERGGVAHTMGDRSGEVRCGCSSLLARLVVEGLELKCRRCRQTVVLRLALDDDEERVPAPNGGTAEA
ncbi:MAG TPA: hypothetical protein VFD71_10505 [Planctomycetota bacterium]|nr:hypothetical protein [Planctomycetota bacterium]